LDSDEYLNYNSYTPSEGPISKCSQLKDGTGPDCAIEYIKQIRNGTHPRAHVPQRIGRQNETIAHWISSGEDPILSNNSKPCIVFPRVTFGYRESTNSSRIHASVPAGFNTTAFHTLQYRQHGPKQGALGKSLIDVSKYDGKQLVRNPHRPFGEQCWNGPHARATDMSLRIHEYTGTLKTFVSRPERNEAMFLNRNRYQVEDEDNSQEDWFYEFVKMVGKDKAFQLTQGAREAAYSETMKIYYRIQRGETVMPAYEWD
jgi:hypothetical protein